MSIRIPHAAAAFAVALLLACVPAAASASPTVVSLTFDGGTSDQAAVQSMLSSRHLNATFFVNSATIGTAGHMSWAQLGSIAAGGNEIGGRTATDVWLPGLTADEAKHEVCDDRDALLAHSLRATSFAFPYRDAGARDEQIVQQCGYNSGRGGGGFYHETLPPFDPYFTQTGPSVDSTTTLAALEARVTNTILDGGGWVEYSMGSVCSACGSYSISPTTLGALLDWLAGKVSAGSITVKTVDGTIGGTLSPAASLPHSQTVVSLTFDDGQANEGIAADKMTAHGMHGTFYVNTGNIGASGFFTWSKLQSMQSAGHEIGGHTIHHVHLPSLTLSQQQTEVCDDRSALLGHGLTATDFAYPSSDLNATTESVVQGCGYNSGRRVGGLQCISCEYAESIPPQDPFDVQAADEILSGTSLSTIEGYVTTVEALGGGWVPLVFHQMCTGCGSYGYDPAVFNAFLDWLAPRTANGTVVRTMREVIGGNVQPTPQPAPAPTVTLTAPTAGQTFSRGATITLSATAADAGGPGLANVAFYVSGTNVATDTTAPYSASWKTTKGSKTIKAIATDVAGKATTSAAVTISVR